MRVGILAVVLVVVGRTGSRGGGEGERAVARLRTSRAALRVGVMIRLPDFGGGLEMGASRSSSSSEDVASESSFAGCRDELGRPFWPVVEDRSNIFGRGVGRLSGFEYPAAALVLDLTPWRPVREVCGLCGLFVMRPWSVVPTHGSSCFSSSDSELSESIFGRRPRACPMICWSAVFCFADLVSASFFFLVSSRILVMESTGRDMVLMVEAFWVRARCFKRMYSAWWRCWVNVLATAWNSSSTMM